MEQINKQHNNKQEQTRRLTMRITYSRQETINLGAYESTKLQVGVEEEVNYAIENVEQCVLRVKNFVNTYLMESIKQLSEETDELIVIKEKLRESIKFKKESLLNDNTNCKKENVVKVVEEVKPMPDLKETLTQATKNRLHKLQLDSVGRLGIKALLKKNYNVDQVSELKLEQLDQFNKYIDLLEVQNVSR